MSTIFPISRILIFLHIQMEVVKSTVDAARGELEQLNGQLIAAQGNQFTKDTSTLQAFERFPAIGREVEKEIKSHEWLKDT